MHHILSPMCHILKFCPNCCEEGQRHISDLQNKKNEKKKKMHTIDPCGGDSRRGLRLVCLMFAENHGSCAVNLFVHSLPPVHDLSPLGLL